MNKQFLKQLKIIDDQELNLNILEIVQAERKLTSQVLSMLAEVERRSLHLKRGYASLFSYCTEYLGYSESAAQRRISSMRLLVEVPQVQVKIESGAMSLSNVAKAASFFRQEKKISQKVYTPVEKEKILSKLEGKTQKEAERELVQISPKPFQKIERQRELTKELSELNFTVSNEVIQKLNRLKELKPYMGMEELVNWMLTRCLKQIDPAQKPKTMSQKISKVHERGQGATLDVYKKPQSSESIENQKCKPLRKSLTRSLRFQVWKKAHSQCEYRDHKTGRICKSKSGLEVDHIQPLILGGSDDIKNLRLLCHKHHKLITQHSLGF